MTGWGWATWKDRWSFFTHFNNLRCFGWYDYDRPFRESPIMLRDIPVSEDAEIERMYAEALKDHGMRYNLSGKIVRYFYKRLRNAVAILKS